MQSTISTPSTTAAESPAAPLSFAASANLPQIGLMGKAGSGKTTAADILEDYGYARASFAGRLRDVAGEIWGAEGHSRDRLQRLGVAVREIDEDAWVNALFNYNAQRFARHARLVIDDVRFPNEYWRLRSEGFVLVRIEAHRTQRVDRLLANGKLQDEAQLEHVSETALDDVIPDYVVTNTTTKGKLEEQLVTILNREGRCG